jgi:thiol-disulfide isomerase/thioredoxin
MTISAGRRERAFNEALTFTQFIDSMQVNQADFQANFASYSLSEAEKTFFTSLPEPVEVLVLAHDWCGDVLATLPLFGRIEADTARLRLHIIPRDPDNLDIAAAYPHPLDGTNHIPTSIFYNQAGEVLGVFIERGSEITALQAAWRKAFFTANPASEGANQAPGELPEETRKALSKYIRARRKEAQPAEKAAILKEIKPILSRVLAPIG